MGIVAILALYFFLPSRTGSTCNMVLNQPSSLFYLFIFFLYWGLTTRHPLWVILCRLPEKGRKEMEEIVEEMKERDREERWKGMKMKKQKK